MAAQMWVTDRDPAVRDLLAGVFAEGESLTPTELEARLADGERPEGLVIDGTQLLELSARLRRSVLGLPRVLICTGVSLAALPAGLVTGAGVAVLGKPFCVEDLEAAVDWLRGTRAGSVRPAMSGSTA